jgi:hypothetical protein
LHANGETEAVSILQKPQAAQTTIIAIIQVAQPAKSVQFNSSLVDPNNTMWCKGCRQDVPALPSGEKQTLCCPRCGEAVCANVQETANGDCPNFRGHRGEAVVDENGTVPFDATTRPPAYDSWELDEQLQHIHRVLHAGKAVVDENGTVPFNAQAARFDPPQAGLPARHVTPSSRPGKRRKKTGRRGARSSLLAWFVFTLGIGSSACGGILLGWSLATGRHELWNVGMPVALVGQIALLAELVLQIDRLWRDNRKAADKLDDVDEQIHELKTTTAMLGTSQGSASATFYSHLARGAGPQILLTDLKSQLDLLAVKIAQET